MSDVNAVSWPGLSHVPFDHDDGWSDRYRAVPKGAFEITTEPNGQRRFWFRCPGACGSIAPLPLRPVVDAKGDSWEWDGNAKSPTLQPSINHVGCWHGWLRSGVFTLA
jgi:hypothetical protein